MHENECARNFAWLSAGDDDDDDDDDDDVECVLLALWIADALLTQSNNVPHELDVERIDGCFLLHHVGRLDCGEAHRCKGTGVLVKMRKMRSHVPKISKEAALCRSAWARLLGVGARRSLET